MPFRPKTTHHFWKISQFNILGRKKQSTFPQSATYLQFQFGRLMRPLGRVLRLASESGVVMLLPGGEFQNGFGGESSAVGQLVGDVLDAVREDVPVPIDPGDFGRRLPPIADAFQFDLAIFGRDQVVALHDLRRIGRHQNGDRGEVAPDARLVLRARRHLALVPRVVVQHDGVDVQGVVP